ncbi:MAG: hypothetical protein JSU77_05090 [Fidelibacterota bacterium]|nr:MAG: hypothetical protein JSU77_05090 [Candidatus Neomarinimicrobiota bacterium]
MMTELLRDELLKSGAYKLVEKQRLDEVIEEQTFQQLGVTQEELAVQLGKLLNVKKVFLGTLGKIQDVRFLSVRIVNVETGQVEVSAIERGFSARDANRAVIQVVRALRGLPPLEESIAAWTTGTSKSVRYWMAYAGVNAGNVVDFHAESAFKSGPIPGQPIWSGNAAEVKSAASFPGLGLRIGAWRRWFGGDLEISAVSHNTVAQKVFYDIQGYIWMPVEKIWYPVVLDTLDIPDNFQRMFSLGFGGNFYIHTPSELAQPYVGFGASLLMNRVKSEQPGPGSYALIVQGLAPEGEELNSTSLGWAFQIPFGIKVPVSKTTFAYVEFRVARHFFDYVSSDVFQKEKDRFTLQTFQFLLGIGRTFR